MSKRKPESLGIYSGKWEWWLLVSKETTYFPPGTNGRTKPAVLDKWFHNNFEKGQEDTYVIEAEDVGEPLMIKLENSQGSGFHRSSDWFVDKVLITSSLSPQKVYEFPCFAWVQRESVFFEGKGTSKWTSSIYQTVYKVISFAPAKSTLKFTSTLLVTSK